MSNEARVPQQTDVVIIGGGPAGSSCAALLAKAGINTVLLEKVRHPRNTVGESFIPHFWRFADRTGVAPKLEKERFLEKAGSITVWKGKIHHFDFGSFGYKRRALHVERDIHDEILLRHAGSCGAQIFEEVPVSSVDFKDPSKPVVKYTDRRGGEKSAEGEIACRIVVDASGHNVVLAKQFGSRVIVGRGLQEYMAMWGYFTNSRYVASDAKSHSMDELETVKPITFILSYEDGWIWHIMLRKEASVGLVINTKNTGALNRARQAQYFHEVVQSTPYLRELLTPAKFVEGSLRSMHDYSYYSTKISGEGFFCIGDAAGFVDPIFSHGVQAAHYNAAAAAAVIEASLANPAGAAEHRKMFDLRIRQYYGFSRSLALGDLGGDGVDPELVKKMMKQMPPLELELMLVASCLSDRSENFRAMAREAGVLGDFGVGFESERHRYLPGLDL